MNVRKPRIGIVGGIGAGKSHVANLLAKYGGRVLNADAIGHEALRQPEIKEAALARWGPDIIDGKGEIRRRSLGQIVFANPAERLALESLVFPYIHQRMTDELKKAESDPAVRYIVVDAAVMLEAGWNKMVDWLVYVDVPREVRLTRVAKRGWSEAELSARESAQWPLERKRTMADVVIDNSDNPELSIERFLRSCQLISRSSVDGVC